ncbi:hypothetical protein [Aquimarina algiphila]|uniref:hypothetical protein n=1 Tax=Aquimarina algiphila TaxID=2047982 RepID=UPI0023302B6B|nr:hypothetical protein [Aquimarina algiphila]
MKSIYIILFTLFCCIGCKSLAVPTPKTDTNTITTISEIEHDTVIKIGQDHSSYHGVLVSKGNKIILKKSTKESPGKYLSVPKVVIENNTIKVDCEAKAQELFAKWKSKHIKTEKQTTTTQYVKVPRELNFFQKSQIWLGRIFLVLLLGFAGWGLLKFKNFTL